jgi:hypothetical protein
VILLIATLLIAFITALISVVHGEEILSTFLKRLILQGYMLVCLVYALPLLLERESNAFDDAIQIICYTFALQGAIHLTGFLVPSVGDFLFDMKRPEFQAFITNNAYNIDRFRAYALCGSIFFELPAAYGIASILFFRMQLKEDSHYISGWKGYVVMFLLFMGISLSGRTGFTGLLIGLVFYLIFSWRKIVNLLKKIVWRAAIVIAILFVTFYYILSPVQRTAFTEDLFPFAFEMYYNYIDYGEIRTSSSDALEAHYFNLNDDTLLRGHGVASHQVANYGHTDAGYMNHLLFGGIFYLLFLVIYQFLYFRAPLFITRQGKDDDDRIDFVCFLFLFAYIFILEYKSPSIGTLHIIEVLYLLIGCAYLIKYYWKGEENYLNKI